MKKWYVFLLLYVALLLVACDSNPGGNTPAQPEVNGFGIAANHVHSLIVLPDAVHTLVMATHYGIYRSQDHGATWQQTSGAPDQLMHGTMTLWLSYNLVDPQRLYVLTANQSTNLPQSSPYGLYTSGDGGKTWQLSIADSNVPSGLIDFAQAGNDGPSEVYIYLSQLGTQGLRVSMDNGKHFTQAGTLPFGNMAWMLAVPGEPGHLFVSGTNGIASTTDGGKHWQVVKDNQGKPIQDDVTDITTTGPHSPIYASGVEGGIYVSRNDGQSFTLVETQHSYNGLTASPQQSDMLYGKQGLGVYRSTDGGQTWSALPPIKGNVTNLVADPSNTDQVYLALSFPTEVYRFQASNSAWQSLTPAAQHS